MERLSELNLVLQDRRHATLGPGAHAMRSLAEAALVDEYDDAAL
jgi:hypothetical protein